MIKNPIWKSFFISSLILLVSMIQAQDVTFQRILPGIDRSMYNMGCEPTADGGFYLLNVSEDMSNSLMIDSTLNISKHDPKGNVTWSVDYTIRNLSYLLDFRFMDIENIGDDTIAVSGIFANSLRATTSQFLLKIDPLNGDPLFSGIVKNDNEILGPSFFSKILRDPLDNINSFGTHVRSDSTIWIHLDKMDKQFNRDTSKSFVALDIDSLPLPTGFMDATVTMDSSLAIATAIISETGLQDIGFLSLDSLYDINWGANFSLANPFYDALQVFGMTETADTGYVFVGSYIQLLSGASVGFTFKTDSIGDVEWAYDINGATPTSLSFPNDVLATSKGEILITGKSADILTGDVFDFGIFLNNEGDTIRQVQYNSDNSFFLDLASGVILVAGDTKESPDGKLLYSTTGIDLTKGGIFTPLVIKSSREGTAICEDTLAADLLTEIIVLKDTLIFAEDNIAIRDTLLTETEIFDNYDIPVLILLDTVFCPQDPIDVTLGNEFEFASTYTWSTGDTTPMIRVFEEGEFMVTVTFDVGVCYELCDTSSITRKDFPEASINPDLSGVCELDQILLFAGSSTDVVIAAWSTGDTVNPLVITEGGTYGVTITDACENTATDEITIDQAAFELQIVMNQQGDFCLDGEIILSPTGVNRLLDGASYIWSNGATSESLLVTEVGVYSVTVTDICEDTAEASIEINEEEVDILLEIGRDNSRRCEFQEMGLRADSPNPLVSYQWSTGEDTQLIIITEPGTYSVTVTDVCGNMEEDDIVISEDELNFSINPQIQLNYSLKYELNCEVDLIATIGSTLFEIESKLWSQGSTNDTITITTAGTYTFVATDICGNTGSAEIVVTEEDLSSPQDFINLSIVERGSCDSLVFAINLESFPAIESIEWSNGTNVDTIPILAAGTYTVTVTDVCGNTATAEREIIFDNLRFPNIFFPVTAINEENRFFKPYVACPEFFTGESYILEVYNRWGNKVFESTNVINGWNGNHDGTNAPGGVYIFRSSWIDSNGDEQKANGNVTLVRQ